MWQQVFSLTDVYGVWVFYPQCIVHRYLINFHGMFYWISLMFRVIRRYFIWKPDVVLFKNLLMVFSFTWIGAVKHQKESWTLSKIICFFSRWKVLWGRHLLFWGSYGLWAVRVQIIVNNIKRIWKKITARLCNSVDIQLSLKNALEFSNNSKWENIDWYYLKGGKGIPCCVEKVPIYENFKTDKSAGCF